jgi:hypothetical protein
VFLSKEWFNETALHMTAGKGQILLLEELWNFAKELQLKPLELINDVLFS